MAKTPFDQGSDRGGERDREADIAEIEERRMDGEADILQQGVEVLALGWRRIEPPEWVRGEDDEGQEGGADQALHGEQRALRRAGRSSPNKVSSVPKIARLSAQRSIELS
jgi:hypothetical protein